MHNALHHSDHVDRLYVSRKEGGRVLVSIQDSVDATKQRLYDYIKIAEVNLLQRPEPIQTTHITELNGPINAGAKFVSEKDRSSPEDSE